MNNRDVLDNAPEGTVSVDDANDYFDAEGRLWNDYHKRFDSHEMPEMPAHSLADIERIVELESQAQWISVEDRLPDTYGSYDSYGNDLTVSNIVATNQGAACYCSSHDNYEGRVWIIVDWCHKEAGKKLDGVTHWMPLPTPSSGGEL